MRLNAEKKHPDYLKAVERIDAAYKRELELIDIMEKVVASFVCFLTFPDAIF